MLLVLAGLGAGKILGQEWDRHGKLPQLGESWDEAVGSGLLPISSNEHALIPPTKHQVPDAHGTISLVAVVERGIFSPAGGLLVAAARLADCHWPKSSPPLAFTGLYDRAICLWLRGDNSLKKGLLVNWR